MGAAVRLLDPDKYRGTVHFAIDVTNASVFVNGTKSSLTPKGELSLPVGTQAVRVTHPEYQKQDDKRNPARVVKNRKHNKSDDRSDEGPFTPLAEDVIYDVPTVQLPDRQ